MTEEDDYLDFEFNDNCYETSWSLMHSWYQSALKLKKLEDNKKKNKW